MATVIVLFNLKKGVDARAYENWARERDSPTVNALPSVQKFRLQKASGVLGSDATPPYQYIEIIDTGSIDELGEDSSGEEMQKVAAEFQQFADNPIFVVTEHTA